MSENETALQKQNTLTPPVTVNQQGSGTNIAYAGIVKTTVYQDKEALDYFDNKLYKQLSDEYYNLIVLNTDYLDSKIKKLSIPRKCVIKKDFATDNNICSEFGELSSKVIETIKTFPTILIDLSASTKDSNSIFAVLGKVDEIEIRPDTTINLVFYRLRNYTISKEYLMAHVAELDIKTGNAISEFNDVHWSIKKINIHHLFQKKGENL